MTVFQALAPGDHVIAPHDAYFGTSKLLNEVFAPWGLETTYVDTTDPAQVEAAADLEAAAKSADIISCATLSRAPLIHGRWLKAGQHVDLVGAFTHEMRETDDEAVKRARIFVDTRAGALKEGGDIVLAVKAWVVNPYRIPSASMEPTLQVGDRITATVRSGDVSTLYGVAAAAPDHAWQVGDLAGLALIGHWNGSTWAQYPSPAVAGRLLAATALSTCEAWAVGYGFDEELQEYVSLSEHYTADCGSVWTDVGFALAGVAGEPQLTGSGPLTPGSAGALTLTQAAPSAPSATDAAISTRRCCAARTGCARKARACSTACSAAGSRPWWPTSARSASSARRTWPNCAACSRNSTMASELLLEASLALTGALVLVLALRVPARRLFGATATYALWWLVPAALVAVLLPAAPEPVAPGRLPTADPASGR